MSLEGSEDYWRARVKKKSLCLSLCFSVRVCACVYLQIDLIVYVCVWGGEKSCSQVCKELL